MLIVAVHLNKIKLMNKKIFNLFFLLFIIIVMTAAFLSAIEWYFASLAVFAASIFIFRKLNRLSPSNKD